jgi:DNA-binding NarL/FixJ family response regulator
MRNLLEKATGIQVVGEANNGDEALRLVQDLSPDVLLLDMEMPGKDGVEVAQALKGVNSYVHILALSAHNDRQYIESVLGSGASGYLVKDEAPEAIIEAVRGVARGEQGWISRQITTKMFTWVRDPIGSASNSLMTDRENQVLEQLLTGKTNQEIGVALGISDKTVEKHMESIFQKLGVTSRTEAAVWAAREGLEEEN